MPVDLKIRSDAAMTQAQNLSFGRGTYFCEGCEMVKDGQPAVTLFGTDHFCDGCATQFQKPIEEILARQRTDEGQEQLRLEDGMAEQDLKAAIARSRQREKMA